MKLYENAFGHVPPASDLAIYLNDLSSGKLTRAGVVDAVAQKAIDEKAGNGLLQLLPNGSQVTPTITNQQAPDGNVTVVADGSEDTVTAGTGNDTFVYTPTSGDLAIDDHNGAWQAPRSNTLQLDQLDPADVTLSRDTANDLIVTCQRHRPR